MSRDDKIGCHSALYLCPLPLCPAPGGKNNIAFPHRLLADKQKEARRKQQRRQSEQLAVTWQAESGGEFQVGALHLPPEEAGDPTEQLGFVGEDAGGAGESSEVIAKTKAQWRGKLGNRLRRER